MRIICKKCGQTKGHHSSEKLRCPIPPPYPESNSIPGIIDRFSQDSRWKAMSVPNQDGTGDGEWMSTDAQMDAAVDAMVKSDDHQTGYERCRWMLKASLPHLSRPLAVSPEVMERLRDGLRDISCSGCSCRYKRHDEECHISIAGELSALLPAKPTAKE